MLAPSAETKRKFQESREGIKSHFNDLLEKILNKNSAIKKYWILGKTKIENSNGVEVVRPFLEACCEKPGLIKDSFVYEVDNKRGVKTLLWVMHPDGELVFPTLQKSIRVASNKGA